MNAPQLSDQSIIGEPIGIFKPVRVNLIAGGILSFLLLGGALTVFFFIGWEIYRSNGNLPWFAEKGFSWTLAGLACLLATVLIVFGFSFATYVRRLIGHQVVIGTKGFGFRHRGVVEDESWTQIIGFREIVLKEKNPFVQWPAQLLLPQFHSSSYMIVTMTGSIYFFDGNSVGHIKTLGKLLRERSAAHGISTFWETVEDYTGALGPNMQLRAKVDVPALLRRPVPPAPSGFRWGPVLTTVGLASAAVLISIGFIGKFYQSFAEQNDRRRQEKQRIENKIRDFGDMIGRELQQGKKFVIKDGKLVSE